MPDPGDTKAGASKGSGPSGPNGPNSGPSSNSGGSGGSKGPGGPNGPNSGPSSNGGSSSGGGSKGPGGPNGPNSGPSSGGGGLGGGGKGGPGGPNGPNSGPSSGGNLGGGGKGGPGGPNGPNSGPSGQGGQSVAGGKGDRLGGNVSKVGGPGAGGMGANNSRNGSSIGSVGLNSGYSALGNIGGGVNPATGKQQAGISGADAYATDAVGGIQAQLDNKFARSPLMNASRPTMSQMVDQYSQYRAPPGASPQKSAAQPSAAPVGDFRAPPTTDVSRTIPNDIEVTRALNAQSVKQALLNGSPTAGPARGMTTDDLFSRSPTGTPAGFMSPEVKRETQYGYDTLYSPNDLNNLYKGINAFGIDDLEQRIAAEQALLGQTIDASQYGGRVSADLNPNLDTPMKGASARTVDPFTDDVAMHWTGNREHPVSEIAGNGYAVTIDNLGNVNYTRAFNADGTMNQTNHMKGMNSGYVGIASQGIEPNEAQLKAAAALGGNWFNNRAGVTTHGFEAGTRIKNGDRPMADVRNKDGSYSTRPDREGVALAAAFTGQDDPGRNWTRTTLSENRPVTMASGLGQGTRETAIAADRRNTGRPTPASGPPVSDMMDRAASPSRAPDRIAGVEPSDGRTSADIAGIGDDALTDGDILRSIGAGTWTQSYDRPERPNLGTSSVVNGGLGIQGYGNGLATGDLATDGVNISSRSPARETTVPDWRQSTYTGRQPTEIDINAYGPDSYDPLGSIRTPPSRPPQGRMSVVGGAGFQAFNSGAGPLGPNFSTGRLSPEDRDTFYGGSSTPVTTGSPEAPSWDGKPQYSDPIMGPADQLPETPKVWSGVEKVPYIGNIAKGFRLFGGLEWDRLSDTEREALMQKWAENNKGYLSNGNLGGSRNELPRYEAANAYIPRDVVAPPPTDKPEDDETDPWGRRKRNSMPIDPYAYGYGPGFNYFTYE